MKVPCNIDQIKTLKKGMKITLSVPDEETQSVLKDIYNFHDRDLLVDMKVDEAKEEQKLHEITEDQRKKIYALFRDIAKETGNNKDNVKEELKRKFTQETDFAKDTFSLANCERETAADFIEFLISFAFEMGIGIEDNPKEYFDDLERAMHVFLDQGVCAACGADGGDDGTVDVHHVDQIQMGHDRTKVDDSDKRKISLCRECHSESHSIGWETFKEKYHVKGVIHNT